MHTFYSKYYNSVINCRVSHKDKTTKKTKYSYFLYSWISFSPTCHELKKSAFINKSSNRKAHNEMLALCYVRKIIKCADFFKNSIEGYLKNENHIFAVGFS